MNPVDDISRELGGKRSTKGNTLVRCPAHEDSKQSLSVKYENGKLLLRCFAGCSFDSIIAELVNRKIIPPLQPAEEYQPQVLCDFEHALVGKFSSYFDDMAHSLVEIYPYRDRNGVLVSFRARFSPKTFRNFKHLGISNNRAGKDSGLPYRLPEMLDALNNNRVVHVLEGEKDCHSAVEFGFAATTFGSSGDYLPEELFRELKPDGRWVVWADNDKPGLERGAATAFALHNHKQLVKLVVSPVGKDFTDWKNAGATKEDIAQLLKDTPRWLPQAEQIVKAQESGVIPKSHYTPGSEAFAGEFVAKEYGHRLRYLSDLRQWLSYSGKVWRLDDAGVHRECVKAMGLVVKNSMGHFDVSLRKKIEKLSNDLESDKGVRNVLNMAKTVQNIVIDTTALDAKNTSHLFSCESGLIDLRQGKIVQESSEHLITKHSPNSAVMGETPQQFLHFVHSMFRNEDVVEWLLNFLGYCLTGESGWQHFMLWEGMPGSGKSQLQTVMRILMGPHCGDLDADSLVATKQRSAGVDSDLASVRGCRLIFASELSPRQKLDEKVIKALSGGDPIKVKFMAKDKFNLTSNGKLVFTANEFPNLSDDGGIARRLATLRFEHPPAVIIEDYARHLLSQEGPAIFGYLIDRAARYYKDRSVLEFPEVIRSWNKERLDELDVVSQWAKSRTIFSVNHFESTKKLFTDFETFCADNLIPVDHTPTSFSRRLRKFGYKPAKNEIDQRGWSNVMLRA